MSLHVSTDLLAPIVQVCKRSLSGSQIYCLWPDPVLAFWLSLFDSAHPWYSVADYSLWPNHVLCLLFWYLLCILILTSVWPWLLYLPATKLPGAQTLVPPGQDHLHIPMPLCALLYLFINSKVNRTDVRKPSRQLGLNQVPSKLPSGIAYGVLSRTIYCLSLQKAIRLSEHTAFKTRSNKQHCNGLLPS